MSKPFTKNQHYIPYSLLRHFANSDNQLLEVLLSTKKIYPSNPSNSMCETYTYEHKNLSPNTIENYFNKIEGEVDMLVKTLIQLIDKTKIGEVDISEVKKVVENLLGRFLVFYYRSGALLTEYSFSNKEYKIPLLSEKILNEDYISKLANVIKGFYEFAIIESNEDFLMSDQFMSTSALRIKSQFFELSNRHIGMNETLLLIPVSSKYYIAYWNTKQSFILKPDNIIKLNEHEVKEINETIINNSYKKCIGQKMERIKEVLPLFKEHSPSQMYFGGGPSGLMMGAIKKKEVFFYQSERDAWELLENMSMMAYRNLDAYDKCACGSGKKYKFCHLTAYRRIQAVMKTFGLAQKEQMRNSLIYGVPMVEQPIDSWSGYNKS